ncbi:MAG: hypothetical protein ABI895_26965 [Deltaproteobacteria bacterium]
MLLFPILLITSLATAGDGERAADGVSVVLLGNGLIENGLLLARLELGSSLEWHTDLSVPAAHPERNQGGVVARGGFVHLNLIDAARFGAGPEVSWVTADTPHEDLLRQRLMTPGVGVWYSPRSSRLFLGVSANTSVSTLGETWFVHALSSEARVGFSL